MNPNKLRFDMPRMSGPRHENGPCWTRRHFLGVAATGWPGLLAAAESNASAAVAERPATKDSHKPPSPLIQIGILPGTFGRGTLEARLHAYRFDGPLLLHGLSEAQVPGCVAFLREKLARLASAL